jgi:hypothetical protein
MALLRPFKGPIRSARQRPRKMPSRLPSTMFTNINMRNCRFLTKSSGFPPATTIGSSGSRRLGRLPLDAHKRFQFARTRHSHEPSDTRWRGSRTYGGAKRLVPRLRRPHGGLAHVLRATGPPATANTSADGLTPTRSRSRAGAAERVWDRRQFLSTQQPGGLSVVSQTYIARNIGARSGRARRRSTLRWPPPPASLPR